MGLITDSTGCECGCDFLHTLEAAGTLSVNCTFVSASAVAACSHLLSRQGETHPWIFNPSKLLLIYVLVGISLIHGPWSGVSPPQRSRALPLWQLDIQLVSIECLFRVCVFLTLHCFCVLLLPIHGILSRCSAFVYLAVFWVFVS